MESDATSLRRAVFQVSPTAIDAAVSKIKEISGKFTPEVALILGSGLGALADHIESVSLIPFRDIPGFPLAHVSGHAGNLVLGYLGGKRVAALAGRSHLYEGWNAQQATFPLRCLAHLGASALIVSNASGGLSPRFQSGQVVLIDNHIDRIQKNPFAQDDQPSILTQLGSHRRNSDPYDANWMELAEGCALELGFNLARGTYLATLGPTYETRAEYRMFSRIGADMVGMSTVPEVTLANQLGLKTLAFSIITNVAKPDAPTKTEHAEVLDWSRRAQSQLIPLIKLLLRRSHSPIDRTPVSAKD